MTPTKHDKPSKMSRDELVMSVMREIINTQREQIRALENELKGQLPGGRYANKKHYLSEAIKHLEVIHRQKKNQQIA